MPGDSTSVDGAIDCGENCTAVQATLAGAVTEPVLERLFKVSERRFKLCSDIEDRFFYQAVYIDCR